MKFNRFEKNRPGQTYFWGRNASHSTSVYVFSLSMDATLIVNNYEL
jgi:hypothetical protein